LTSFDFPIPDSILEFESYPKITNYVATVNLNVQFNLNSLVLYLSSTDRKPSRFAAIAIKIHPTTCLLFSSGNMVITGGRTEMGAKLAAHVYRLMLEKIPQPVLDKETGQFIITTLEDYTSFDSFKVVNIVGSGKLFHNNQVNLGSLSKYDIGLIGWDAQIFPGLRFKIRRNPIECPIKANALMAHIFQGANDVIMGARVKEDIYKAHIFLKRTVSQHLSNPIVGLENINTTNNNLPSAMTVDSSSAFCSHTGSQTSSSIPAIKKRGRKPKAKTDTSKSPHMQYAKEYTKLLHDALRSQDNIMLDSGIKKRSKPNKATRIRNPKRGVKQPIDDGSPIRDELGNEVNTAKQLFTETSTAAIAGEVPDFANLANEDQEFMMEFMEEFTIND
jgi:transcription initiation factor TFIID TATA-box-binding protein